VAVRARAVDDSSTAKSTSLPAEVGFLHHTGCVHDVVADTTTLQIVRMASLPRLHSTSVRSGTSQRSDPSRQFKSEVICLLFDKCKDALSSEHGTVALALVCRLGGFDLASDRFEHGQRLR
jgi:hypothetical protein